MLDGQGRFVFCLVYQIFAHNCYSHDLPDQRIFSSSPGLMYLTVGGGGNGKDSRNVGLKYLCDTVTGNTISSHPSGGNSSQLWNSVSTNRDWR